MPSKYHNRRVETDGLWFDSQAEARRWQELSLLEKAGEIEDLRFHPRYEIVPAQNQRGKKYSAAYYEADFSYVQEGHVIVEEVKGFETPIWRIKQKLFIQRYPAIELRILKV